MLIVFFSCLCPALFSTCSFSSFAVCSFRVSSRSQWNFLLPIPTFFFSDLWWNVTRIESKRKKKMENIKKKVLSCREKRSWNWKNYRLMFGKIFEKSLKSHKRLSRYLENFTIFFRVSSFLSSELSLWNLSLGILSLLKFKFHQECSSACFVPSSW